jgi:hypothetical protein
MAQRSAGSALAVLDAATGTVLACAHAVERVASPPARWARPVVRQVRAVGTALTPLVVLDARNSLQREGRRARITLGTRSVELLDALVPVLLDLILDRIDLTALVLRRVDLDQVAAGLDLDTTAARLDIAKILDRIDLNELIEQRVDLDRIAARLDLDTTAARLDIAKILDRIDLNELIEQRVDLDRIAARLDLDGVAAGLDLDRVAARLDVDAVAARLDIDRVMARVDLIGLAEFVVDGIDLPRIIRESTGSVASEGLREVRTRSMEADQALAHLMDRMLLRRGSGGRDRAGRNGGSDRADRAGLNGASDRAGQDGTPDLASRNGTPDGPGPGGTGAD